MHGQLARRVGLVIASLMCVSAFMLLFPWALLDDVAIDMRAEHTHGTVIKSVYAGRHIGDTLLSGRKRVFRMQFKFTAPNGEVLNGYCFTYADIAALAIVPVEYDPRDPTRARIVDGFIALGGYAAGLWAMSFLAFLVFGFWNYRRWRSHRLDLIEHGVLAAGVIERAWRDDSRDDEAGWVDFHFASGEQNLRLTQSMEGARYRKAAALAKASGEISILHQSDWPRACLIVELMPSCLNES
jgi:hypothetical protein